MAQLNVKSLRPAVLASLCLGGVLLVACDDTRRGLEQDADEATEVGSQELQEADREMERDLTEFKADANQRLAEMDQEMELLDKRMETAGTEVKRETREEISELREERAELSRDLEALKAESADEWNEAKRDMDVRIGAFGKAINGALDDIGDDIEQGLE